jgi:ribose transport system ATP-binding protein
VLIMDEPTSSLTQVDTENLFRVIRKLAAKGVSIIYISHFLEECQALCDRYTVLRDGESVGTGDMKTVRLPEIIRLMVGREVESIYPRVPRPMGEPVLQIRNLAGAKKPRDTTLKLRAGEILGIAGLIGAGRTETLRVVFGLDRLESGSVAIFDKDSARPSPRSRLADGVGLLSENRKEEGLMLHRSIADNLTVTRYRPVSKFGFISSRLQTDTARQWMQKLDVRGREPGQPIGQLSGGNQQKVALGRLLYHDARVFLLDEPTRGIDVGSKAQIYQIIGELAAAGKAIIFVSSYLPELLGVCDTIAVMCRGVIREQKPAADWSEQAIITAAIGQTAEQN